MSPGDIALKVWRNRFSKLHLNFSLALPSFTKQIYGPTKNRQLLCHFCYSSFTCTVWSVISCIFPLSYSFVHVHFDHID
ncbi:unnamed protein product [Brassica napus]|uniref:(rape) hypothetical protein n=1 Tax=Brassica napus TaxID=3708 RepID=A0A816Q5M3_BRANA|nr:unnamed protein product [Brassica napus]